jgi:hypothetical protein
MEIKIVVVSAFMKISNNAEYMHEDMTMVWQMVMHSASPIDVYPEQERITHPIIMF